MEKKEQPSVLELNVKELNNEANLLHEHLKNLHNRLKPFMDLSIVVEERAKQEKVGGASIVKEIKGVQDLVIECDNLVLDLEKSLVL